MTVSVSGHRRPPPWRGPIPLGTELVARHAELPAALLLAVEQSGAANRWLSERERIARALDGLTNG